MRAVKNLMMPVMHSVTLDIEGCIKYLFICIGRFFMFEKFTFMVDGDTHAKIPHAELQLSELAARAPYFTLRYSNSP